MELVLDKVSQKNVNLPIKQNQFISIKLYEYFCRCFLRADSRLASLLEEMRLRADLPPSDGQRPDRRTLFGHAQASSSSGTDGFNKSHLTYSTARLSDKKSTSLFAWNFKEEVMVNRHIAENRFMTKWILQHFAENIFQKSLVSPKCRIF